MTDDDGAVPSLAMPPALERGMPLLSPAKKEVFNVDEFLCSRAHGQDVPSILQELRTYKHSLQDSLVQLINEKYRDFVSLATMIHSDANAIHEAGDDAELQAIRKSLSETRDMLAATETSFAQLCAEGKREREKKRQLMTLLEIDSTMHQIQLLFDKAPSAAVERLSLTDLAGCDVDADEPAQVSESSKLDPPVFSASERVSRIFHHYTWLQHLLDDVDCDNFQTLLLTIQPRLTDTFERVSSETYALLMGVLERAVPQKGQLNQEQLGQLSLALQMCLLLGAPTTMDAKSRLQKYLIEPWLPGYLTAPNPRDGPLDASIYTDEEELACLHELTGLRLGPPVAPSASADTLCLYNALLFAARCSADVCVCAERIDGALLDLFNDVLWKSVCTGLMETHGAHLFFVGRPDAFYRNYRLSLAFLDAFAALAPSPRAAAVFRTHETTKAFERRWQLSAFFHLRARETVMALERSLSDTAAMLPAAAVPGMAGFFHSAFAGLLHAFVQPWRAVCHIEVLSAREWRLSLHVLSRYRTWLRHVLPEHEAPRDADASAPTSRTGTPGPSEPGLASDEVASLHTLVAYLADALTFEARVRRVFHAWIVPKIVHGPRATSAEAGTVLDALTAALDASLGVAEALAPRIADEVLRVLCRRCAEPLRHVRAASSQYRALSGPQASSTAMPEPSAYIAHVLLPLRQALGIEEGAALPTPLRQLPVDVQQTWVANVVDSTVARYASAADTVARNLESLRRLKRTTPGIATNDATDDAVYAQLRVDIAALAADVDDLGRGAHLDLSTETKAWRALRKSAGCLT